MERRACGRMDSGRLGAFDSVIKSVFDRLVASVLLVVLAPVLLGCAAAVKLVGPPGRVVETVPRSGLGGELFAMRNFPVPAAPRIRAIFVRYGLHHLPELVNVLRGEMSLVGPRPAHRATPAPTLRPGITGLWALGSTADRGPADAARLHDDYVGTWSLRNDIRILIRSAAAVRYRSEMDRPEPPTRPKQAF